MIRLHLAKPACSACCRWPGTAGVILGAGVLIAGFGRSAQEQPAVPQKAGLPTDLERVPADVAFLVSVRVADLWNSEPIKEMRQKRALELAEGIKGLEQEIGAAPDEIERATLVMGDFRTMRSLVFVTTLKPNDRAKILSTALVKAAQHANQTYFVSDEKQAVCFLNDRSYVIGAPDTVRAYLDRPFVGKGPLSPVLQLADQKHQVVGGLVVPPLGAGGRLPVQLIAFADLLKARTATATVDLGEQSTAELRLNFANQEEAKRAERPFRAAIDMARAGLTDALREATRQPGGGTRVTELVKLTDAALQSASVTRKGADLQIELSVKTDGLAVVAALIGGVQSMRHVANRAHHAQSTNNLKQLALAMHNYHSAYGHLPPPAIYGKDGKPLLSWRVLLLPFLVEGNLYKEFNLQEPWNSGHNQKLLAQMPNVYADPNVKTAEPVTVYQAFVGPGAFFEGTKKLSFGADFPDGMENTFMIVEAANPVPWTKPEDLPFDPSKPLPKLGGHTPGGFTVAFCNGAVYVLRQNIKEALLRALITRNGGEPIDPNAFRESIR
jgi:hypothetical protein